jgi:GNAT superfamily N-acetyltransferase
VAHLRPLTPADHGALLEAILANVNWDSDVMRLEDIARNNLLSHYADFHPDRGDFGFLLYSQNVWIGIVWLMFFTSDEPGYGFVADGVPELCVCVRKGFRRQGIGRTLMTHACAEAHTRNLPGISLSVQEANPARALYTSMGFAEVARSGTALTMLADPATLAAFASPPRT